MFENVSAFLLSAFLLTSVVSLCLPYPIIILL